MAISNIINKKKCLYLGNLNALRMGSYKVSGKQWKILNYKKPDDFVISTGKTFSVRKFVEMSFKEVGIKIRWQGKGIMKISLNKIKGKHCKSRS